MERDAGDVIRLEGGKSAGQRQGAGGNARFLPISPVARL